MMPMNEQMVTESPVELVLAPTQMIQKKQKTCYRQQHPLTAMVAVMTEMSVVLLAEHFLTLIPVAKMAQQKVTALTVLSRR